jgi:hypothetical protein
MIKSLIILVLAVLLCGGAYLSRPSKGDFEQFVRKQVETRSDNFLIRLLAEGRIDSYLESCTFEDRYLWVTVEQGGQTRYFGAFSQFWPINKDAPATAVEQAAPAAPAPAAQPVKQDKPRPPMWE